MRLLTYDCGLRSVNHFNPRTRVGCDGVSSHRNDSHLRISIHAPGWGATDQDPVTVDGQTDFNPRTRVGCDMITVSFLAIRSRFQSTHPGGVRLHSNMLMQWVWLFQSTHPGGVRRHHIIVDQGEVPISIHAPGWGATLMIMT